MIDTAQSTDLDQRVNRCGFLKGCTMMAAALGISEAMIPKLVEAATSAQKNPDGITSSIITGNKFRPRRLK